VGGWRRLHNEELHNLYTSPNIIRVNKLRRMKWEGHVAGMGERRNAYNIFIAKHEWKSPFSKPRHRWKDNIRMYLKELEWEVVDWVHLAQDRDQ